VFGGTEKLVHTRTVTFDSVPFVADVPATGNPSGPALSAAHLQITMNSLAFLLVLNLGAIVGGLFAS
jgi:hypothetical protein